jgi:hypothetical protein
MDDDRVATRPIQVAKQRPGGEFMVKETEKADQAKVTCRSLLIVARQGKGLPATFLPKFLLVHCGRRGDVVEYPE